MDRVFRIMVNGLYDLIHVSCSLHWWQLLAAVYQVPGRGMHALHVPGRPGSNSYY